MGSMQLLQSIDDPLAVGPAVSVGLLPVFYGVGFKAVFYVADQRLQNKFLD